MINTKTSTNKQELIKKGFIIAGLMNLSVMVFSRAFTNDAINQADPMVMSDFGLLMIVLWGLAYIATAKVVSVNLSSLKWLAVVFAIEKLIYGVVWINWHLNNSLSQLYNQDLFAGIFYSIYGLNDLLFMLFFAWVFFKATKNKNAQYRN